MSKPRRHQADGKLRDVSGELGQRALLRSSEAKYFGVGKIDKDQALDYHLRKKMDLKTVERWLGPALNYDPDAEASPAAVARVTCACGHPHPWG